MSRTSRRVGTKNKAAQLKAVTQYYARFRNGQSRHNGKPMFGGKRPEQPNI